MPIYNDQLIIKQKFLPIETGLFLYGTGTTLARYDSEFLSPPWSTVKGSVPLAKGGRRLGIPCKTKKI